MMWALKKRERNIFDTNYTSTKNDQRGYEHKVNALTTTDSLSSYICQFLPIRFPTKHFWRQNRRKVVFAQQKYLLIFYVKEGIFYEGITIRSQKRQTEKLECWTGNERKEPNCLYISILFDLFSSNINYTHYK